MIDLTCPQCQTPISADAPPGEAVICLLCSASFVPASGAISKGSEPIDAEVSPQDEVVLKELVALQNQQPGWGGSLLLIISLVLFIGSMWAGGTWEGIVILVVVLFVHELGHYLAMRAFGYRNLSMFFIPFFGAAVAGKHYNVAGWKKALVALAGPVPGILIGAPLGILGLALDQPQLVQVAIVALILNGFNLLPFLPLDGGWVVHAVLFVRHPVLDVIFRVLAALGLFGVAYVGGNWLLGGLAVFMLIGIPLEWRLANIAHRLRREGFMAASADATSIPVQAALTILAAIRPALPPQTPPKLLAQNVVKMFGNLNAAPPGVAATITLLVLHAGSLLFAIVMALLLVIMNKPKG